MLSLNFLKKLSEDVSKSHSSIDKVKNLSVFSLLLSIPGIGYSSVQSLSEFFGFTCHTKIGDLSSEDYKSIYNFIVTSILHEDFLKEFSNENKRHYVEIKHYKGFRYKNGYPANGQRTKTNARTVRKFAFK